jgi:hypothetical protein
MAFCGRTRIADVDRGILLPESLRRLEITGV